MKRRKEKTEAPSSRKGAARMKPRTSKHIYILALVEHRQIGPSHSIAIVVLPLPRCQKAIQPPRYAWRRLETESLVQGMLLQCSNIIEPLASRSATRFSNALGRLQGAFTL